MLIRFAEQKITHFKIPAFTLSKGEILVIQFPTDELFYQSESELVALLTGKVSKRDIEIVSPFIFADHFKERGVFRWLFPTSVNTYHHKYANKRNGIYKKIYETPWLMSKTKVKTLAGNYRKQLALYTALSWTNNIIFDLCAVDPSGGVQLYNFVKTRVSSGGSAILIDRYDEFKNNCTTFIQAEYLDGYTANP